MTAVADYLATAKAPDLLTDTVLAEGSIGTFQQHQILDADIATGSRTCRLAPAPPVAVIRTAGGAAQAFGVLDCQTSWRAKPGHVVGLNDNLRAWGSDLGAGQSVTYEDEAQVAVSVLKNGETQLIGYSNNLVYATLY